MSFELMKERIKSSGATPRDEKIIDARRTLADDFDNDTAYSKNIFYWNNGTDSKNGEHLDIKFYNRKYSAVNGTTKSFQTQITDLIINGACIHDESDDTYWICKEDTFNVDDIHCQGTFTQCNYLLSWQDDFGVVYKYWCKTMDSSSYSSGVSGNANLQIGSDQLMIIIPFDENTKKLKRDKRFMIMADGCEPICYKLTRPDTTTYMKNNVGCMCLILSESSDYNAEKDNIELKICNYITPTIPSIPTDDENQDKTTVHLTISSTKDYVKVGGSYAAFKGIVTDDDGNVTVDIGTFGIMADFASRLDTNDTTPNQIKIKASDGCSDLAGETFELVFTVGNVSLSKAITIEE